MVNLYKRDTRGIVLTKTLARTMFYDEDSFNQALDFWYSEGWVDSIQDC